MALGFLRTYLAPQRRRIALLAGLMLGALALQFTLPRLMQQFIDQALAGAPLQALTAIGVLYLIIAVGANVVTVGWHTLANNIGILATNEIRSALAAHCLALDMGFHNARTPGEMIERIDGDVGRLTGFLSKFFVELALDALVVLVGTALLFAIDWRVGLPFAVCSLLAALTVRAFGPRLRALAEREQQSSAELFGFLEERLTGTEDIRANGANAYVLSRHVARGRTLINNGLKQALLGAASWRTMVLLGDLGMALSLAAGGLRALDGALSPGAVYMIYAYTSQIRDPFENLLRQFDEMQRAIASINRVRELFDIKPALSEPAHPVVLPSGALSVALDHLTFAYPGDDAVLSDLTLNLPAGETLGLLGRTGSGKTTLTRLLLRLYDPLQGAVRIGGVDTRAITNDELRARVAIVTQDVQIFSGSVRDNVTLFDRAIADAAVRHALERVGLDDWLRSQPRGLDALLAAGGAGLSAGEAQLLAFARTFLRDPGLVLLDEASSRLDPATERKLDRVVDSLLAGRSGVIIAHRLSTCNAWTRSPSWRTAGWSNTVRAPRWPPTQTRVLRNCCARASRRRWHERTDGDTVQRRPRDAA